MQSDPMSVQIPDNYDGPREILFEFKSIGNQVRVAAIDPDTGIEVVIIAPQSAAQSDMQRVAAAKLTKQIVKSAGR